MGAEGAGQTPPPNTGTSPARQRVWDLPVRLLHWSLVACVLGAWLTRHNHMGEGHQVWGYGALAVATLRLLWGFFGGGRYARFAQFVRRMAPTLAYARAVLAGHAARYIGHNPLGGWMVVALLACMGLLGFHRLAVHHRHVLGLWLAGHAA